jgi:putrescine transport system substrate-binding protein
VLGAFVSLLASGACLAEERTVRIYNWIEYLPPEILESFQEETGIRPIYDVFDSVETLESKLLTGNSGYDVVYPGSANVSHLIAAGAVQPLDRSQLPSWQQLDPEFMKGLEAVGDPGNRYAAPYLWGTTLIGYNVDKVRQVLGADAPINSWDIIFKEENLAKLASCGDGQDPAVHLLLQFITLRHGPGQWRRLHRRRLVRRRGTRQAPGRCRRQGCQRGNGAAQGRCADVV